ncbi:hypothetical protein [Methanobrevibacter sp.]
MAYRVNSKNITRLRIWATSVMIYFRFQ